MTVSAECQVVGSASCLRRVAWSALLDERESRLDWVLMKVEVGLLVHGALTCSLRKQHCTAGECFLGVGHSVRSGCWAVVEAASAATR